MMKNKIILFILFILSDFLSCTKKTDIDMNLRNLLSGLFISHFLMIGFAIAAPENQINNDIIVSGYETTVMEQGKTNVSPVFRIKNQGTRTYERVILKYTTPQVLKGGIV